MKSTLEPETGTAQLSISDVRAQVGGQHVLQGLSLSVNQGEFLAVLGHNGAGKSTLLRTIVGLVKPQSGSIAFAGSNITGAATPALVNSGICLVPQQRGYFENLSVEDNLTLRSSEGSITIDTVYELFPILVERKRQLVGTMSGGQRQMVAISIALMSNPKLLMLDEPSVGLQPNLVDRVLQVARQINREYGITVILVEQNIDKTLAVADRVAVINRGKVVLDRPTESVKSSEIWALL